MSKLIGGPDLRARLASLQGVGPEFAAEWATDTAQRMRRTAPNARRAESQRFTTKLGHNGFRAAVYGAFWWVFVDRGTKAHDIVGRKGGSLKFEVAGQTIFAKKVHLKRQARRPFITRAAQEALAGSKWTETVIKSWNRRRLSSHKGFL